MPDSPSKSQHSQAAAAIFVFVFLSNYLTTPSAISFLHSHAWVADIVGSLMATLTVLKIYSPDPREGPQQAGGRPQE